MVPVYNCPFPIVCRTIKSLVSQDYPDLRIVIIDDCSEKSLFTSLHEAFSGLPKLTLIRNEKNMGFANTLNKALQLINDEKYFFVLEHDCELLSPNYITRAVEYFVSEAVGAVCGENVLPSKEEMSSIKRIFVNHLSEDVHDSNVSTVGFLLLKADAFRVSVLKEVGGFQSAGHWKFASEEHIISFKIRSSGYLITKDPNLRFKGYWGGQENLLQNLKKEALYGRGLGCAFATKMSDLDIGSSYQLKAKKISRLIQLQYICLSICSLPLLFFDLLFSFILATIAFVIYFVYLFRGSLAFGYGKDRSLFIITGYLRAWVYIPNFVLGISYGFFTRLTSRPVASVQRKLKEGDN